jgi:hypothetical protein
MVMVMVERQLCYGWWDSEQVVTRSNLPDGHKNAWNKDEERGVKTKSLAGGEARGKRRRLGVGSRNQTLARAGGGLRII